jgi:hypothetical protein
MSSTLRLSLVLLVCFTGLYAASDANSLNLAENAGFELSLVEKDRPSGWYFFTSKAGSIALTREVKRSGEQCAKISTQKTPGAFLGLSQTLSVKPGEKYTFSVYLLNDKHDPLGGSAHGQLNIEWKDNTGKEIARITGAPWDLLVSRLRWEMYTIRNVEAPKGAVEGVFGIHLLDGEKGGQGSVFLDDVMITR